MNAESIAKALRGKRSGGGWIACCPAHDDRHPSFSITEKDGRCLIYCHAGCPQERVIDALRDLGFWQYDQEAPLKSLKQLPVTPTPLVADDQARISRAIKIWQNSQPAEGTLVAKYLRSRGLYLPVPATLRFAPNYRHKTGSSYPCMVALVTRGTDRKPLGIHRTFLAKDGIGKAPIEPNKMMLGPCSGGAVRLAKADESIMIGEGIETTLSAMLATKIPAWAALSVSGMRRLELPLNIQNVTILCDADPAGESAAEEFARRLSQEGRRVRTAHPPKGFDFNDLLLGLHNSAEGLDHE
jgi:putative DNA primase/helicase